MGKLDGGDGDEGGKGFGEVLDVLGETPVPPQSGEGSLNHPAARQDDEAVHGVAPLDDLRAQRRYFCHRSFNLPRLVAAMGLDRFEPREVPPATRSRVMGIVTMCIGTGPVGVMAIGILSGQVGPR